MYVDIACRGKMERDEAGKYNLLSLRSEIINVSYQRDTKIRIKQK